MKNILFLTDYSVHSKYHYQYALKIAQHFNATIHFGHISLSVTSVLLEDEMDGSIMFARNLENYVEIEYEEETEKLKFFAEGQTPKQNRHQLGDFFIRSGNVATEILDIANTAQIDLIVMGMRQKKKLANTLFGNLALAVLDKAPCPVFLIPPQAMYLGITNIVYAVDFETPDLVSLRLLLEWAKAFETTLHLLYVITYSAIIKPAPYIDAFLEAFPEEIAEGLIEFQYVKGDIQNEIIEYVKDIDADMVVLAQGARKFWKYLLTPSLVERVAGEIDVPILVFKRTIPNTATP